MFTPDNGRQNFTRPEGGQTPFAAGKRTIMEGGFRVPAVVRWPRKVPAGKVENGLMARLDWLPASAAAAGYPDIVEERTKGKQLGDRTSKVQRARSAREPLSAQKRGTEDVRRHRTPGRWWLLLMALGSLAPVSSAVAQEPSVSRFKLSIGGYIYEPQKCATCCHLSRFAEGGQVGVIAKPFETFR